MSKTQYSNKVKIYENPDTRVTLYRALGPGNLEVVIKEQVHVKMQSASAAVDEALNQARVFHPAVVKVFGCRLDETTRGVLQTSIIIEAMDRDLGQEIDQRLAERRYWAESELLEMFVSLTSALRYGEEVGVSHRDVKPSNVYLRGGRVKLGDFGSSTTSDFEKTKKTLHGTPFFLSPELKEFYIRFLQDPSAECEYDSFKSDVYSLGITFVSMILLEPLTEMTHISNLRETTARLIARMSVSDRLKEIVARMLEIEPSNRISLQELESLLTVCCNPQFVPRSIEEAKQSDFTDAGERKQPIVCATEEYKQAPESAAPGTEAKPPKRAKKQCLCDPRHQYTDWTLQDPALTTVCSKVTDSFCSEACARNFVGIAKHEVCVGCSVPMLGDKQKQRLRQNIVILPCLHMMHGAQCLRQMLLSETANFTKREEVKCPRCERKVDPHFVEDYFGPKALAKFVSDLHQKVCRACGKEETGQIQGCKHLFCSKCREETAGRCRFCSGISYQVSGA